MRKVLLFAFVLTVCLVPAGLLCGPNDFPYVGLPLHERAEKLQADMRDHNLCEGLVIPRNLFPPQGNSDNSTGHHEDGCNCSGPYLAALSYQYAATKQPEVLQWCRETAGALEKLENVTGVPGAFGRSFYRSDKPQPHEEWFFFPGEWHQSTSMKGYRWLGDPSSDSLTHMLYGNAIYYDLVADDVEKERVSRLVNRIMSRVIDYNMKLTDVDGKMTLWGNFCPDLPKENLNFLLPLAHLKIAYHVTSDPKFQHKYLELIRKCNYHEEAIGAKLIGTLDATAAPWDDYLGMRGLYHLMRHETDPWLLGFYRAALERYWFVFKDKHNAYFDFIYQVLVPDSNVVDEESLKDLGTLTGARRWSGTETMRREGPDDVITGTWQESPHQYLLVYWMGRYYKFVPESR